MIRKHTFVLYGLVLLSSVGCGFRQPAEQVQYYTLEYEAPDPLDAPPLPVTIHVDRFESIPPYDSRRIVYAESAFQRTTYAYHQWMTNPADILTNLFIRDLRAADFARTIVVEVPESEADYSIEGVVEEFYEDDTSPDWQAVMTLSFTLAHTGNRSEPGRILFQKTYRQKNSMERNNPVSLARAMSEAMRTVSINFMKDAYHQIASSHPLSSEADEKPGVGKIKTGPADQERRQAPF